MPQEAQWIQQAKDGDQAAFRHIVEQHQQQVRATVHGMLGDTAEADDVAQEVFIRLYRALPDFREEAKLSTYLSRIAINLSLNELKRRKRKGRWLTFTRQDGPEAGISDQSVDPERQEMRDALQKALQTLEPEFRAVVILRLVEGYPVKETADILQLPPGTVASRLARAQQKLRTILDQWL
ncbi:MAG TPA: sigma-70 family RNA polymerase sigma factor [Phaeodactylibacter sp.]|nr:sigma-70 family RNA polymerase sigma factor [Phaeodactylibacter sp.]